MQDLALVDKAISEISELSLDEQVAYLGRVASELMEDMYGSACYPINSFSVVLRLNGGEASFRTQITEDEVQEHVGEVNVIATFVEWLSDECFDQLDELSLNYVAGMLRPELDDLGSEFSLFVRFSNGEDSSSNPPVDEEIDLQETVALLIAEAMKREFVTTRQTQWDDEQ